MKLHFKNLQEAFLRNAKVYVRIAAYMFCVLVILMQVLNALKIQYLPPVKPFLTCRLCQGSNKKQACNTALQSL